MSRSWFDSCVLTTLSCRLLQFTTLGYLICAICVTTTAAQDPDSKKLASDPKLEGWWKFDDTSGTSVVDSSKHKRHGKLNGGATFDKASVAGRIGKALELGSADTLVRMTGYKGIAGTGPRTITIWLKTKTSKGDLVSWGKDDFGQMWILRFIRRHVGATPNGGYYYMAADVHDENWHHIAVVVREAELPNLHDDVTLYLDGEIAEIDRIGLLDLWPLETGADQEVTVGKGYVGAVDDLRIFSRALSDEEIQVIFRQAK